MDYMTKFRSLSARVMNAYRSAASCAAFILTALLISLSLGAQAAVLKINPSANSPNEINVSGELSASVTHTAEGMTIEIPGVEISLVCDTNTDPDLCTVTVGSGSASSGSGSSSSGSGSASSGSGSSSSGSGSSSSDSGDDSSCDPAFDFGCQDGTLGGTGTASASDDSSDSSDSSGSTGYVAPETSSSDDDDPCSRKTGYNPNCVSTSGGSTEAGAFPIGGARKVANASGDHNFGSANPTGKARITVPSGTVTVVGLVMKSGASPSAGSVSFAQASNIQGVALRAWISTAPDGAHVGSCAYSGYAEGVLGFTIGGGGSCNLSPGSTYYFNMALCSSTPNDLYCNQPGAKASATGGIIVVSSDYSG